MLSDKKPSKYELPIVAEVCPNCESEIELRWDVNTMGYQAFCPVCGKPLMLCDACMHSGEDGAYTGYCDWNRKTRSCYRMKGEMQAKLRMKDYCVHLTNAQHGDVYVSALNAEDAKKKAIALYHRRGVEWYEEGLTEVSAEEE